jgi:hypothetical protein
MSDESTIIPSPIVTKSRLTYDGPRGPLFKAMAEARKHFEPLSKDGKADVSNREGKFLYSFTYAPLDVVLAALEPGMRAAGISLMQPFDGDVMYTIVACGESSMTVETPLPNWGSPQELGSLLTYLRRYQLKGLFGVADAEDDDGNAASGNKAAVTRKEPTVAPKTTSKLAANISALCIDSAKKAGLDKPAFDAACLSSTGKKFSEFNGEDAAKFLDSLATAP